ncbi:VOC family protein [Candidatus Uhrbacteria bacterium]|nr:VOC family protein [Candidatus Uhrbacteria bacterium]MBD3284554.1 VOC family protein [Candidatus Uhrbacteria bacterium]
MNPVGWFEIPVTDMDRAETFYRSLLGYKLERHEMGPNLMSWFPMERDAAQATGTLIKGEAYTPSHEGTIIYFSAPDLEATLEKVEGLGGRVLVPKTDIGEHGYIAHIEDTEGNRIALHRTK